MRLTLRVVVGDRIGVASTNALGNARVSDVAERAMRFALQSQPDREFPGLASSEGDAPASQDLRAAATATATPARRAELVRTILARSLEAGVFPSGSLATSETSLVVANSEGVRRAATMTEAEAVLVCTAADQATGWAEWLGRDIDELDVDALTLRAAERALAAQDPKAVEPGEWTVLLEPAAVAELVSLLSYCGFGGRAEQEGRSFMSDRIGEKVTGGRITITDDASDPRTLAWPFDFEGTTRQRVALIEEGVARGVVHDTRTGAKAGAHSTGHALPAPSTEGPLAFNLVLAPGEDTLDSLISGIDRGLLVTRFFYTNVLDTKRTLATGMTRDGLLIVEDGAMVGAAKNLRMTQSVLEAFSRVAGLTAETEAHHGLFGVAVTPAMRIDGMTFSSATEF